MREITLLIKPTSGGCNYRCDYCFYHDVTEHRESANRGIMSRQTLDLLLNRAFESGAKKINLVWQGGEPTLAGLDFFKYMAQRVRKLKPAGVRVFHSLQTNGSTINDDLAEFFAKEQFLIGLSLDGPKEYHDGLRLDPQQKGTFQRTMKAAEILSKHKADFNILTVVNRKNVRHAGKLYRFFVKNGFKFLQFIPCIPPFGEREESLFTPSPEQYGRFLTELYRLWETDYRAGNYISIRHIDNAIHIIAGGIPEECGMMGRCSANIVVESDGQVYPCDFYCTDDYLLGNIADSSLLELVTSDKARSFIEPSLNLPQECTQCRYNFICRGGCRRYRDYGGEYEKNMFCKGLMAYYEACLTSMVEIAASLTR